MGSIAAASVSPWSPLQEPTVYPPMDLNREILILAPLT